MNVKIPILLALLVPCAPLEQRATIRRTRERVVCAY
jgi:hypothetical protein